MPNNEETYKKIKDVLVDSIVIESDQGGSVDITDKCKHISIYEDMFQSFMSGYARIVDEHNLVKHFPIIGQETIKIKYKTPGFNKDMKKLVFDIYSSEGRTKADNMKSEVYDIRFISKEYRLCRSDRISKAYTGKISDMVSSIFEEYMPDSSALVLSTKGEHKYVIPDLNVQETIEWLSTRAMSDESPNNSNYVFFQNSNGFNFVPISSLATQTPSYSYEAIPTSTSMEPKNSSSLYKQFYNIETFSVPRQFNRLEEMESGLFSSNIIVHDVINKKYSVGINTYIQNWEDSDHCEEYPYLPLKNRYSNNANSFGVIKSKHVGLHDDYPESQNPEEWALKRVSSLKGFDTLKMEIEIPGNSDIKVGETMNIRVPSSEPLKRQDPDWFDKYLSGKYLITSVRHHISVLESREYTSIVELSRDSISERTPDKSTFMGTGSSDSGNNGEIIR